MYCLGEGTEHSSARTAQLFRLPDENASKFFPYRLKHLRITNNPNFRLEAIEELAKRNLRFLEASGLNSSFDVLRQLSDDDLPNLKFLALRNTQVLVPIVELQTSQKVLEELNEKRPKLVITNRRNYFINGVIQDGKAYINKEFLGDINAVLNDLSEIDGFCCMGSVCSEYGLEEKKYPYMASGCLRASGSLLVGTTILDSRGCMVMEFKLEDSDFRAIALYQFKLGRRVAETCRDMVTAFGREAPTETTVQKWYLEFQPKGMQHITEKGNGAAPIYFPFGNRYEEIDKRYRFSQRTNLMPLAASYPLRSCDPMDAEFGDREIHSYRRQLFKPNIAPSNVEAISRSDIFPDVVLMTIFKYTHPVDLINGVSGVSRRWNKLANVPSNYTSVRVIIDEDSVTTGSAKAFVQRVLINHVLQGLM
uniref:F-box domain-containing protein n=1 Tax=Ascaris lumbricoides TaxID=6252 RepID=A0A0M3IM94_ASCLU